MIFRIRWFKKSATYRFPSGPAFTPAGPDTTASAAGPSSPEKPPMPLPVMVLIIPLESTFRITLFSLSVMNRLPDSSTTTPFGLSSFAATAGPTTQTILYYKSKKSWTHYSPEFHEYPPNSPHFTLL